MTDMDRFELLRQRFVAAEEKLVIRASNWFGEGRDDIGEKLEHKAMVYKQCADELARVLAGETPPAPGDAWETKQENGK